jgi:hypothetical protein
LRKIARLLVLTGKKPSQVGGWRNKKLSLLAVSSVVILLFTIILVRSVNLATANVMPIQLPSITIGSDGSIDPTGMPINRTGSAYTLTGNISGYSLDINCSNVTVDGAGYTLRTEMVSQNVAINIEANGVTVKNMRIYGYYEVGINVVGSFNMIAKNTISTEMGTGINLPSDYNNITGNTIGDWGLGIDLTGKYNNIIGNIIRNAGGSIWLELDSACFNNIIGNNMSSRGVSLVTLEATSKYDASNLHASSNVFRLNNFAVRNLYFEPISLMGGAKSFAAYDLHIFDNGSVGNYWNNYGGTDANHDGIIDKPYEIAGMMSDHYPLMEPYNPDSSKIVLSSPTEPFPTTPFVTSIVTVAVVGAVGTCLLVYLRKRWS